MLGTPVLNDARRPTNSSSVLNGNIAVPVQHRVFLSAFLCAFPAAGRNSFVAARCRRRGYFHDHVSRMSVTSAAWVAIDSAGLGQPFRSHPCQVGIASGFGQGGGRSRLGYRCRHAAWEAWVHGTRH